MSCNTCICCVTETCEMEVEIVMSKMEDGRLFLKFEDGSYGTLKEDPRTGYIYVEVYGK